MHNHVYSLTQSHCATKAAVIFIHLNEIYNKIYFYTLGFLKLYRHLYQCIRNIGKQFDIEHLDKLRQHLHTRGGYETGYGYGQTSLQLVPAGLFISLRPFRSFQLIYFEISLDTIVLEFYKGYCSFQYCFIRNNVLLINFYIHQIIGKVF